MADQDAQIVLQLLLGSIRTHHKLTAIGRNTGAVSGSGGEWGVLHSLVEGGPQTVPELARSRPVARQHIQMLANALRKRGFIRFVTNPLHKRSRLATITAEGRAHHDRLLAQFMEMAGRLGTVLPPGAAAQALETQRTLLAGLDALLAVSNGENGQSE